MRNRGNLAILISLVVVGAVAYWLALNPDTDEADALPTPTGGETSTLWTVSGADITAFEIAESASGRKARFERLDVAAASEPQWVIVAPVESLADQPRVASAVSGIANLIVTRSLTEVVELGPFGVLSPEYILQVTVDDSEQPLVANIGAANPGDSAYYVLRESDTYAVLVSKTGLDALIGLIDAPPLQPTPTSAPPGPAPEPTQIGGS